MELQATYNSADHLGADTVKTLLITFADHIGPLHTVTVTLTVSCPDFHTRIVKNLDTTFVEVPTYYYDVSLNSLETFPLNYWYIGPRDLEDDI